MARSTNCLKKQAKILALMQRQFPDVKKRFMVMETGKLVENIVDKTPVDTGRLRAAWRAQDPKIEGDVWIISCSNNVEYAEFVEYGHRWVRRGFKNIKLEDYNPETDKTGFTRGRFMARDGMEETARGSQERWKEHVQKWLALFERLR